MTETLGTHVAILRVSRELLLQALGLPAETKIDDARVAVDFPGVIEFRIQHSDLPLLPDGMTIPFVKAELKGIKETVYTPKFTRWLIE